MAITRGMAVVVMVSRSWGKYNVWPSAQAHNFITYILPIFTEKHT